MTRMSEIPPERLKEMTPAVPAFVEMLLTENAALRPSARAPGRVVGRIRPVVPVQLAPEQLVESQRDLDLGSRVARTGLEQEDPVRGVLGEPCGEHASRGSAADDEMVDHVRMMRDSGRRRHPADRRMSSHASRALYPSCDAAVVHTSQRFNSRHE